MTYDEIEAAVTAALGDGDAQIELMAITDNFRVVTRCLNKTFSQVFQQLRRHDQLLAEYLSLRTSLATAPNSTAVFDLWTPSNQYLAKYGTEYQDVHAIYEQQFTALAYADPETEATNAMLSEAERFRSEHNIENASLC